MSVVVGASSEQTVSFDMKSALGNVVHSDEGNNEEDNLRQKKPALLT